MTGCLLRRGQAEPQWRRLREGNLLQPAKKTLDAHSRAGFATVHCLWFHESRSPMAVVARTEANHLDKDTEHAVLDLIAAAYHPAGASLFGSRSRSTRHPDSDADVAVLPNGPYQRFLPTKLAMADVAFDVLHETGINLSPLPVLAGRVEPPGKLLQPVCFRIPPMAGSG